MESPVLTLYHTGVVVDDLEEAMSAWERALGLHWAPPRRSTTPLRCPAGILGRDVRITYSLEGPHHIELLEQVDPAPYLALPGGRHVHHVGYRTADLVGQVRRLEELGFSCDLSPMTGDGQPDRFAYHRSPLSPGFWIELVADDQAREIDTWLADAAAEQGVPYTSLFARFGGAG